MSNSIKANNFRRLLALLLLLGGLIYLTSTFWASALLDDADSVHAEAAREMADNGDFITLHADGIRYLEKAPLIYWAAAIGYRWFTRSEVAVRLPIALASIALILLTASFARWAFGDRAGFYAGMIIGTSAGIFLFTRIFIPDVLVALWLTASLYSFLRAEEKIGKGEDAGDWLLGLYGSAALAILTKGLIGAVFPGAIIFLYLLLRKKLSLIPRLWPVAGTIFFFAIAAPWHWLASVRNQNPQGHGFFWFYFINEHVLRYLGKRYPVDYDKVPLLLFYALHLVWLFPWSIFLPVWLSQQFKRNQQQPEEINKPAQSTNLVLWIWPILIILFFSFSTRQEYYTLPALPAFAMLLGRSLAWVEQQTKDRLPRRLLDWSRAGLFAFSIIGAIAVAALLYFTRNINVNSDISTVLTRNPEYYALSLGHIFDLTPQSFAALRWPLIGATLAFLFGTGISWWLGRRERHWGANLALALMMTVFFICSQQALGVFEPYLSSRPLANLIKQQFNPGDLIVINGEYESGSSINYYTNQPVMMLNNRTANLEFGSYFPDAPKRFLTDSELPTVWDDAEHRVFLVTEVEKAPQLKSVLGSRPIYQLSELGGKYLYSNRPGTGLIR